MGINFESQTNKIFAGKFRQLLKLYYITKNFWLWLSLGDHAFLYIKRRILFFQLYIQISS